MATDGNREVRVIVTIVMSLPSAENSFWAGCELLLFKPCSWYTPLGHDRYWDSYQKGREAAEILFSQFHSS